MTWFVLNYIPPRGHKRSELPTLIERFSPELELFAPTFVSLQTEGGKVAKKERPLLYHYIFLKGDEQTIKQFCYYNQGFSFVMDCAEKGRHLTVTDQTIRDFRIIAQFYAGKLPCFPLKEINLEEGDKVQIVSGPCAGLTGTYMSRKGGRSGNILVAVDTSLAAIVYDIKAEYVRVLEFSRDSRRVYDQLDAFTSRLLSYLKTKETENTGTVSAEDTAFATVFTRRLGSVKLHNPKLEAKLYILLYAAYSVLSDSEKAAESMERYRALERHITNPKTLSLVSTITTSFPTSPI